MPRRTDIGRATGLRAIAVAALLAAGCDGGGRGGDGGETAPGVSQDDPRITDAGFTASLKAAESYLDGGELEKADVILSRAVDVRPSDPDAQELMGRLLVMQSQDAAPRSPVASARLSQEAWEAYAIAAEARPDDAALQTSAGLIAHRAGDLDGALACFARAEAADPDGSGQAALFAGQIHLERGAVDAAAAAFERTLALDPDEPYAISSLGIARAAQGRYDDAVALGADARAVAPDDPAIRLMEARILRQVGRAEEALARLLAVPPAQRDASGMTAEVAESYRALGDPLAAATTWADAWERVDRAASARSGATPTPATWGLNAVEAWLDAGETDEAARWLQRMKPRATPAEEDRWTSLDATLRAKIAGQGGEGAAG